MIFAKILKEKKAGRNFFMCLMFFRICFHHLQDCSPLEKTSRYQIWVLKDFHFCDGGFDIIIQLVEPRDL